MRKLVFLFSFPILCLIGFVLISEGKISWKEWTFQIPRQEASLITITVTSDNLPKFDLPKLIEVNLTDNQIQVFENGFLRDTFHILSQGQYGKWFQTPTGIFRVGTKSKEKISSLADPPVFMNHAVQMYEDFFIHERTKYLDGSLTSYSYTGGCLRLEPEEAKTFFELAQRGDVIISYTTFKDYRLKEGFHAPVDYEHFWIRQRFNNPLRGVYLNSNNRAQEYIHHAGLDLSPNPEASDYQVYNILDGKVVSLIHNGNGDHGLGNTVIIEHQLNNQTIYSLYAHLSNIRSDLKIGQLVSQGEILGQLGATGYGCNYWRVGIDGCESTNPLDFHLHFELKTKPVLGSPQESNCWVNSRLVPCYGYAPANPTAYGYLDPFLFLFEEIPHNYLAF